jgi:cation diffusion facilitator family transporter
MHQPSQTTGQASSAITSAAQQQLRMRVIIISLAVGTVLLILKFVTFRLTHSAAVLSDALESIINVVAASFATLSVWMSAKPPDREHPYGHGKIEYFSAGFEGALIIVAAAGIFYSGLQHLFQPRELPNLEAGLIILCCATAVNLFLGIWLTRVGRRTDSITLIADGKHILTDVYTSAAVLIGLLIVYTTQYLWLDGAMACLVGINILFTGTQLVYQSFVRLMDASDPLLLDQITSALEQHRRMEWIDIHQLRAWRSGNLIHIDLHLVLPKDLSIDQGHEQAKAVERVLTDHFHGNASVLVHIDPCNENQCRVCRQNACKWRSCPLDSREPWKKDHLIRSLAENSEMDLHRPQ